MSCSIKTVEEIAQCVVTFRDWLQFARPFIEVGIALLGLGSVVSIGVMTWFLKKSRKDIENHQAAESALRATAKEASEARQKAEENERSTNLNLKLALEELKRASGPVEQQHAHLVAENERLSGKLSLLRSSSLGDGAEFWSRKGDPTRRLADYEKLLRNSIPVMLFANQKGGVGKTTLCTNLAAYFATQGERVLLIDLDYQGSATSLLLAQSGQRPEEFPSMVDLLLADNLNDLWSGTAIQKACENLDYISCWYSFERLERHLEYVWAANDGEDDVRYRLARAVLSPYVQSTYKRVFIDAPPRMTTGFINGICASTHLFVPTVVDRVSASAIGTFATQFKKLRDSANSVIEFAGIIGTMTAQQKVSKAASVAVDAANKAARKALNSGKDYFLPDATMVRTVKVSYSTEHGIAYLQADANTREMFQVIGKAVAQIAPTRSA